MREAETRGLTLGAGGASAGLQVLRKNLFGSAPGVILFLTISVSTWPLMN